MKISNNKKYKILIEANKILMYQNDGVKRYLLELLKALYSITDVIDEKWEIDLYISGRTISLKESGFYLFDYQDNMSGKNKITTLYLRFYNKVLVKIGLKFTSQVFFFQNLISKVTFSKTSLFNASSTDFVNRKYDLIHVPLPQHFEPFRKGNDRYLLTIHDLTHKLFKDYHQERNIRFSELGINTFINKNADYLCVSNSTLVDMKSNYGISDDKLHLVYEAADNSIFKPNTNCDKAKLVRDKYKLTDSPYLLTLSTLEPRKNLLNTIKAFELLLQDNPSLDFNLVIGGRNGWMNNELDNFKHKDRILFTGFIEENDLSVIYSEAKVLCYVSYYEGFGLPLLEAMCCDTPVIYGDNSSMKELFENYGLPADPSDIHDIKNKMASVIESIENYQKYKSLSHKRAKDFSWSKAAAETLNVYENVIMSNR